MKSQYDIVVNELRDHLRVMERAARTVPRLGREDAFRLYIALYYVHAVVTSPQYKGVLSSALGREELQGQVLAMLSRCYAVLSLMYVGHSLRGFHVKTVLRAVEAFLSENAWFYRK